VNEHDELRALIHRTVESSIRVGCQSARRFGFRNRHRNIPETIRIPFYVVATEAENRSYDYCVRIQPEWSAEDEANKLKVQQDIGIFVNPRHEMGGQDEYPKVT
jgi:hypothetical protein